MPPRSSRTGAPGGRIPPDIVTDQTSAHDPVHGYLPIGWTWDEWARGRRDPQAVVEAAAKRIDGGARAAMLAFHDMGVPTFDYGNNIRQMALEEGRRATPSPSRASSPPISVRCSAGRRPVPLGGAVGDPEDIYRPTPR